MDSGAKIIYRLMSAYNDVRELEDDDVRMMYIERLFWVLNVINIDTSRFCRLADAGKIYGYNKKEMPDDIYNYLAKSKDDDS